VLYEIAFLCMDLEAYDRKFLSNDFLSAYDKQFNCLRAKEDDLIFNYFKCLRANVRAKVHSMRAMQAEDDREFRFHLEEMKKYIVLMGVYISS
jgi:aminoglycoside phosphotransferase family enzyme